MTRSSLNNPAPGPADGYAGVLLLDKPTGMSSNAALQCVRRMLGRIKAGHTGTLDPMATGLLPVCLGEATKFAGGLLEADKVYEAVVRLGVATDTGDAEGEIVSRGDVTGAAERVGAMLAEFQGEIEQTPPMHSAIKFRGRPLYEYARAGRYIERHARRVTVHEIAVLGVSSPDVALRIRCSKGTYVRTLAHDIGARLGCGAHLAALRRTGIGALHIEDAVSLATLEAMEPTQRWAYALNADVLLSHLPAVVLIAADARAILQGKLVTQPGAAAATAGPVRLYDESGSFLGVGVYHPDGRIAPRRMRSIVGCEAADLSPA